MSVIISCAHIGCQFGQRFLLYDINWEVQKGDHWIVFGLNGSGKTTLLSIIAGFNAFTHGQLKVFGAEYDEDNILPLRRRIGWVSSSFFDKYLSWESVLSVVLSGISGTLGLSRLVTDQDVKRSLSLLRQMRLGDKTDQPFALLSKGERQSALIARALVSNPEILILDEPGTGLDIFARDWVLGTVADFARLTDMTIIYVTHYAEEILPMFQQALLLRQGRVFCQGAAAELFTDKVLTDFLDLPVTVSLVDKRYHINPEGRWGHV
ncbi:MAG: ATP-binding cassette domain-containing protein [Gracilibacteraceae bacterium]|jgi:iron complex transport system ATP-binding protein|nr:ATP-binding cassette domain-containing protein [Gracilibacteraceae bacterium]